MNRYLDKLPSEIPRSKMSEKLLSARQLPEIIANPILENTTLVYSIPFRGEWENGNLIRTLEGFLAQKPKEGEAFEVELIANIGKEGLTWLIVEDLREQIKETSEKAGVLWEEAEKRKKEVQESLTDDQKTSFKFGYGYEPDDSQYKELTQQAIMTNEKVLQLIEKSKFEFQPEGEAENERDKETHAFLNETKAAAYFIKKIIKVQALARRIKEGEKGEETQNKLKDIINSGEDELQKNLLKKAADRAHQISFALVDASMNTLEDTAYREVNISSLRTLGADVAMARFEGQEDVVLSLFDADTVPENTSAVRDIQNLFDSDQRLTYAFAGLTYSVAGTSKSHVSIAPSEKIERTINYNYHNTHGSPQILFRLRAYKRLEQIKGIQGCGFCGDEDRDTGFFLIMNFGKLQEGILFERSLEGQLPSSVLTADRIGGFCDSGVRGERSKEGYRNSDFEKDIARIHGYRDDLLEMVAKEDPAKQTEIITFLEAAKIKFRKKEKTQKRMNCLVAGTFLKAVERDLINLDSTNKLIILENEILKITGGKALLHFVKANSSLIEEILKCPQDLGVMNYLIGRSKQLPSDIKELTPFQAAMREYLGTIPESGDILYKSEKGKKEENYWKEDYKLKGWKVEDTRSPKSKKSLLHEMIIEMQAMGATYRTFFEAQDNFETANQTLDRMKDNPDMKDREYPYGDLEKRIEAIKVQFTKIKKSKEEKSWFDKLRFDSIPAWRFLKELF